MMKLFAGQKGEDAAESAFSSKPVCKTLAHANAVLIKSLLPHRARVDRVP